MSVGQIITAFLVVSVFLGIRRWVVRVVGTTLKSLTRRTTTDLDDFLLDALIKPFELAFVIVGLYLGVQILPASEAVSDLYDTLIRSLIALLVFWALYRSIDPLSSFMGHGIEMGGSVSMRETMKGFIVKLVKCLVITLGIATVLQEWGFNVAGVLGSVGLVGMAVALGAKDFIANLFAGLTIFLDRMFENGNWIRTPDVDGIVEEIGFRATRIRRFDKALVTIPNARLAGEALINFSRMTHRRIYWTIGVEYRTTKAQLQLIIQDTLAYLTNSEDFETDPTRTKTFVSVDSFGASSIDIMVYCFTKTTVWGEWLVCKERLAYAIKDIVEGHGTAFAFPSTSLYVETLPFGQPEPFPIPRQAPPFPSQTS